MRLLWRIFMIIVFAILLKGALLPETNAYIVWPESKPWVQRVEWEVLQIQKAAQDLPASIEVVIRRFFRDIKPQIEAKSV